MTAVIYGTFQKPAQLFCALSRSVHGRFVYSLGDARHFSGLANPDVKRVLLVAVPCSVGYCLRRLVIFFIAVPTPCFPAPDLFVAQKVYRVRDVGRKVFFTLPLLLETINFAPELIS